MGTTVPIGWLGCPAYGEIIDDTFLPSKTPLDQNYQIPPEYEYAPVNLLKQMRDRKINVGMVVNLTATTRYYDEEDFTREGVKFKHISCEGRLAAPTPAQAAEFIKICRTFSTQNPGRAIVVHCTHGCNRTGFMICYYLCSERDWSIDAAVAHFMAKRPPGIYKQDYLNELFNIFGDSDDPVPQAPEKPIWDDLTTGEPTATIEVNQKEFYEGITDVRLVCDEALKQRIYRHCCQLCDYKTNGHHISFPGAQPVSMDQSNIQLLKTHRYRVSWKADGCRYMMYIQDENNIFFLTRSLHLWRVNNLKFPKIDDLSSHLTDTLLDGEMVTDIVNGQNIPKYLIYDVISLNGNVVATQNFDKRCGLIKCVIVAARRNAKYANLIPAEGEPFKVGDKGFFYIQDSKKTWNLQVTHEKDGLIFQPVDAPYTGGTCQGILKWKPPNLNSIDFRLVIREERQNGCLPETYAYLHVSNRAEAITKFKLDKEQSSYRQYNNKIVEMTLQNQKWTIMRERTDKLNANSWETAVAVFRSIKQPVSEKYLFDFIATIPQEAKR